MQQALQRPRTSHFAALAPAGLALGVGLLYAAGAVVKTGQLANADVPVRDTLPLVPLEQVLALGIGVMTAGVAVLAVSALYVALLLTVSSDRVASALAPPGKPAGEQPRLLRLRFWERRVRWWQTVALFTSACLFVGLLAYQFWMFDVFAAAPTAVGLAIAVLAPQDLRGGRRLVLVLLAIYFGVFLAAGVGRAYVAPQPLSRVQLDLRDGSHLRGRLLVAAGDTWYVSRHKDSWEAIPVAEIGHAEVEVEHRTTLRPPLKALWERLR